MAQAKTDEVYNPSIQALLSQCETDWGNPADSQKLLVPYGIKPFDLALYGIDVINGELLVVIAPEKKRKTTFIVNVITNIMMDKTHAEKPFVVVDSLESGLPPNRYRDTIISNVATRKLLDDGHKHREFCPLCNDKECHALGISPEFLRFTPRTIVQQKAIEWAIDQMMGWNLYIYGPNPHQGDTRNLKDAEDRWIRLIEEFGAKIIVTDHLQQYSFYGDISDYEKQIRTTAVCSDVVSKYSVAMFMLSQVSLGSAKESRDGVGKLNAAGGKKIHAEANTIFYTDYESGSGEMTVGILDSRKSNVFRVVMPIEDVSGAFYGIPKYEAK